MTAEARNGMRQPQVMNAWFDVEVFESKSMSCMITRKVPLARKKPNGAPSCGHIAAQARLPGAAVSVASSAAPDHSPPRPRPCAKRISASSAGAQYPT